MKLGRKRTQVRGFRRSGVRATGASFLRHELMALTGAAHMARYLIERAFSDPLNIPQNDAGAEAIGNVVQNNSEEGVTWVHSYVTPDHKKTFCIYDGPSPEAVRRTASRNKLPITQIWEVSVLSPYAYRA